MRHRSRIRTSQAGANQATTLSLLRRHQRLSRAEIARRAGVSEASVSRTVVELARRRLVTEHSISRSTGGRPAVLLQLDESRYRTIGVDIHSWETRLSVGTLDGRILESSYFRTPSEPLAVLDAIARQVEKLREGLGDCTVEGVGVSARGLVNSQTGVVERGSDPAWIRIPVRDHLQARLDLPVYVENNVRAAAFAEYHYGSPDVQDAHCLLFVLVGEGIGVSMMVDGELYFGQHMAAGEFGQMVIADAPGTARHDRPGCLEKLASNEAICLRYRSANGTKRFAEGSDVNASAQQICHLAMSGDRAAVTTLESAARYLGVGISNVIWGLDPDAVVLDGAICEAWPLIGPVVRDQFADGAEFSNFRNLVIRPSALRGEAATVGAVALPFQPLFSTGEHAGARLESKAERFA